MLTPVAISTEMPISLQTDGANVATLWCDAVMWPLHSVML